MDRMVRPSAILAGPALLLAIASSPAQDLGPAVDLKVGQAAVIPVTIADGAVTLGKARLERPGAAPGAGEIEVAVVKNGLSPYADVTALEKTSQAVDFVVTGLIGDIKIDERKLCGRLDAPMTGRIYSGSWRISVNRFTVTPQGQTCEP